MDIGTNCEMVFRTREGIFCTAAAAGPAFEGSGIPCGSRAVEGAVDHYFPDGTFSVLGGGEAAGLCGSAMIDFLAVMRRKGRLNEFGRLQPKAEQFAFTETLSIREEEISQLLKAKAAVAAGIQTLADSCGTRSDVFFSPEDSPVIWIRPMPGRSECLPEVELPDRGATPVLRARRNWRQNRNCSRNSNDSPRCRTNCR